MRSAPLGWLLTLGAIVAIGPLSVDMYLPALPELQRALDADAAATQQTLAAFFAGLALGQLFYGPLSDRYGRKPPLVAGLAIFVVASIGCALAADIDALVALRFAQALGGCAGMVLTRAMVRDLYPPQDMARILSLLVLVMGAAPMLAPLLGSATLAIAGWRAIFVILALFGLACLLRVWRSLAETHPPERRLVVLTPGSALLGYGQLLQHRRFVGYALAGGVAQGGMFAYISSSAFVFIEVHGLSPSAFGMLFGANAAGLIAASQLNRHLLRRLPAQRVLQAALAVYFVAALALAAAALTGLGGVWGLALPLWVAIASLGFTFPNAIAAAMAPFGDRAGSASALLGTLQFALAGAASVVAGLAYDGSARPMALVIAACGAGALVLLHTLARPEPAAPTPVSR